MKGAIEVPLFPYGFFQAIQVGTSTSTGLYLFPMPFCKNQAERQEQMKLRIRYENDFQTIELDAKATDEMWVSLSLDCDEDMPQEEKEKLIQYSFDEQYNKPEYNICHRETRHLEDAKMRNKEGVEEVNTDEAIMARAIDKSVFTKSIDELAERMDHELQYEYYCGWIRKVLKPSAAEMVIAIVLDGLSVGDYAESIGDDANNVSHRYRRAINKLKKVFSKTSF